MGKWVLAARHPCNDSSSVFRHCLIYETPEQFSAALARFGGGGTGHSQPVSPVSGLSQPVSPVVVERHQLSWEAATERCACMCLQSE